VEKRALCTTPFIYLLLGGSLSELDHTVEAKGSHREKATNKSEVIFSHLHSFQLVDLSKKDKSMMQHKREGEKLKLFCLVTVKNKHHKSNRSRQTTNWNEYFLGKISK